MAPAQGLHQARHPFPPRASPGPAELGLQPGSRVAPTWTRGRPGSDQGRPRARRGGRSLRVPRVSHPRSVVMSATVETTAVRPFQIQIPDEQLADLRRRIEATRWPSEQFVADRSQGVQLATMQALARY